MLALSRSVPSYSSFMRRFQQRAFHATPILRLPKVISSINLQTLSEHCQKGTLKTRCQRLPSQELFPKNLFFQMILKGVNIPELFFNAINNGDVDTVNALLKTGVGAGVMNKQGVTALHYLMFHAHSINQNAAEQIMILLLAHRAKPQIDDSSLRFLHQACKKYSASFVKSLVRDYHLSVNEKDAYGKTPLHHACHYQRLDLIDTLLALNADPYISDKNELLPIQHIFNLREGRGKSILELFFSHHRDFKMTQEQISMLLHQSIERNDYASAKILIPLVADLNELHHHLSPLYRAIENDAYYIATLLMEQKVIVEPRTSEELKVLKSAYITNFPAPRSFLERMKEVSPIVKEALDFLKGEK